MKKWWGIVSIGALSLFSSCTDGIYTVLGRDLGDPEVTIPTVVTMQNEYTVNCRWATDENADEYLLQRAEDASSLSYETIYQGTDTAYADKQLNSDQARYFYRLYKRRGNTWFGPSDPGFGVILDASNDEYENNDDESLAKCFTNTLIGMTYYFSSTGKPDGQSVVIYDPDWYYVYVPVGCQATILLKYSGSYALRVKQKNGDWKQITSDNTFVVNNTSNVSGNMPFEIMYDPTNNFSNGSGTYTSYTLGLTSIDPYSN
jgi:hypothetical protein